jgi:hypothetical protein
MSNWTKFKLRLSSRLIWGAINSISLALVFLGLAFVVPMATSAQRPFAPPQISLLADIPWSIHLYASPSSDGTGLTAFTGKTADICKNGRLTFFADTGVPTPFPGTYKPDEGFYSGSLGGFFPAGTAPEQGFLDVRCELDNGDKLISDHPIIFWRYYYNGVEIDLPSDDHNAILRLFTNSLVGPHYIIVMDTNGLPGGLPVGIQAIGLPYSFRASGAVFDSINTMSLDLYYSGTILGAADPLTLRIFEWDAPNDTWTDTGNQTLSTLQGSRLNKPATKFTTYILGSTPRWCDSFTSGIGLETLNGIIRTAGTLHLNANAGTAIGKLYTPTLPLRAWQSVSYTANIPAGTNLIVSVLSQNNQVLKPNVTSGQSLADIDPGLHPGLKLRVEMSTTLPGTTPELLEWCLLADVTDEIYLPLVFKG